MDVSHPLPEVTELLSQMMAHRGRVVRQIAGAPRAAMSAALSQSHAAPLASLTDAQVPKSRPRLRQWLEKSVSSSFFLKTVYESVTPWGREDLRHRETVEAFERQVRERQETLKEERARSAMATTREDLKFLDQTDRQLMAAMVRKGYFTVQPTIRNLQMADSDLGPMAYALPGSDGLIYLVGDKLGDYYDGLPRGPRAQKELADRVSEGELPMGLKEHDHQVYTRWYVLFHEVAHCEFRHLLAPFEPTPGSMPTSQRDAINNWITGPLRVTSNDAATLLNENHSDALATMLLLEATGHNPKAYAAIQARIDERRQTREQAERYTLSCVAKGAELGGRMACVHATDWAMERVLTNVNEWRGQPPKALRALARRYASDGLLDFLDTERHLDGKPIGAILAANVIPPEPQRQALLNHLGLMALSYVHGGEPTGWLKEHPHHPAARVIQDAWRAALPAVRKLLAEPSHSFPEAGHTLADGCRKFEAQAVAALNECLERATRTALSPASRNVQAMERSFAVQRELVQQGLGLPVSMPDQLALDAWRQHRAKISASMPSAGGAKIH